MFMYVAVIKVIINHIFKSVSIYVEFFSLRESGLDFSSDFLYLTQFFLFMFIINIALIFNHNEDMLGNVPIFL